MMIGLLGATFLVGFVYVLVRAGSIAHYRSQREFWTELLRELTKGRG